MSECTAREGRQQGIVILGGLIDFGSVRAHLAPSF